MTFTFPDINEYKDVSLAGLSFVEMRATIGLEQDLRYNQYGNECIARGISPLAYHFLNHSYAGTGSPEEQADFSYSVVGPRIPLMLDTEPNLGFDAPVAEGVRFVQRYRANGGVCRSVYKPKWSWENQGKPSLKPFQDLGLALVASDYGVPYSDAGRGWTPYGGYDQVSIWQYTETGDLGGTHGAIDWNAFRGTLNELIVLVGIPTSHGSISPWFYPSQNNR